MTYSLVVQFKQALDLLDELTDTLLPMDGVAGVYRDRVEVWKKTARSLVNEHIGRDYGQIGQVLDALMCDKCSHTATQHGFVCRPEDGGIIYRGGHCEEEGCECIFTQTQLPPFHLNEEGVAVLHLNEDGIAVL